MKKILLVNPKREKCNVISPHLGLAMLSAVLRQAGHQVLTVDYQFRHNTPSIKNFIIEFRPDLVGISLYTAAFREGRKIIDSVYNFNLPIIVGGPHATLYSDDLRSETKIDYIVRGEAESAICQLVAGAKKQKTPEIIESEPSDISKLPFPDFTSFFEYNELLDYPWLTGRGCPYSCIFCPVHLLSSKTWRHRQPSEGIEEIVQAKEKFPKLKAIGILDDCIADKKYLKDLLTLYIDKRIGLPLTALNLRADLIDEEVICLFKKCDCPSINLGAEHGDPEVFRNINKSETLEDIKRAARLIKANRISLFLCFIIALPGDSFKKTLASINLARDLHADHVFWNTLIPYKGTRVRAYFENLPGAKIFSELNRSSWVDGDFMCDEPCVQTKEFNAQEQKKAYLKAILNTGHAALNRWNSLPRLLFYVIRYGLYFDFFNWFCRRIKLSRLGIFFKFF